MTRIPDGSGGFYDQPSFDPRPPLCQGMPLPTDHVLNPQDNLTGGGHLFRQQSQYGKPTTFLGAIFDLVSFLFYKIFLIAVVASMAILMFAYQAWLYWQCYPQQKFSASIPNYWHTIFYIALAVAVSWMIWKISKSDLKGALWKSYFVLMVATVWGLLNILSFSGGYPNHWDFKLIWSTPAVLILTLVAALPLLVGMLIVTLRAIRMILIAVGAYIMGFAWLIIIVGIIIGIFYLWSYAKTGHPYNWYQCN